MLFEEPPKFRGLPEDAFEVFAIPNREQRRRAIVERIHPALSELGEDLERRLSVKAEEPLHRHLPRLDWPRGYQPFCTWLALSRKAHGYQAGPQLNVGVHAGYVAVRLGWDVGSVAFGRFEFLGRHGSLEKQLAELSQAHDLRFRVYATAPWPEGSVLVFESPADVVGSFDEVQRRGAWWEIGRRYDLPASHSLVCSPGFGEEVGAMLDALLPIYERIEAHV